MNNFCSLILIIIANIICFPFLSFFSSQTIDPNADVLVECALGGQNVVAAKDLEWQGNLHKGSFVIMRWEGIPWYGLVKDLEHDEDEEEDSSDDDLPLSVLITKEKVRCFDLLYPPTFPLNAI